MNDEKVLIDIETLDKILSVVAKSVKEKSKEDEYYELFCELSRIYFDYQFSEI